MNCGKKVMLNPTNIVIPANFAQNSEYIRPEIFGHQKCRARHVAHQRAADHDVVEVRHDKVSRSQVKVGSHRREVKTGKSADGEQARKSQERRSCGW